MTGRPRYKVEQMTAALGQSKGMVTVAARLLRCDPETVRNYAKRHPAVADKIREERESMLDVAELALLKAVQGGEGWAVCFTLKTIGKSRGYVERQEHTGRDGAPQEYEVTISDARERLRSRITELAPRSRARLLPPPVDEDTG